MRNEKTFFIDNSNEDVTASVTRHRTPNLQGGTDTELCIRVHDVFDREVNPNAVVYGDCVLWLSPEQARRLARKLLKLTSDKGKKHTETPLLPPELEKSWMKK